MSVRTRETHGFFVGRHGDMRQLQQPVKKIYRAWVNAKNRCYNRNYKGYSNYGGRGIIVCQRWLDSFQDFMADVGVPPSARHSFGRIDNAGNYEPGNVRWETLVEQAQNKRVNILATIEGRTLCAAEWARQSGVGRSTICRRIKRGIVGEKLLKKPRYQRRSSE